MVRDHLLTFYLFFILAALSSSCQSNQKDKENIVQETEETQNPDTIPPVDAVGIIDLTASELTAAYLANEVKADHDYKGKQILVTGEIIDIKKGIGDNIYVVLKGSEKHRAVQCYYTDEKDAQTLKKGMKISFRGKCDGLWVNVILSDCERIGEGGK